MNTASDIVRAYLAAMEARDLETAKSFLAPGFTMIFPGDVHLGSLEELIAWAKDRYARVGKTFDAFDEMTHDGKDIVYCHGALNGEWLDGTEFSGIRFIDRFTLMNGKLIHHQVWNDLGEILAARR